MRYYLKINEHPNGYNINHISCLHLPFAGGASYYYYDNYYFYCFYYSLFKNWGTWIDNDEDLSKNILNILGLTLKKKNTSNTSDLIKGLKDKIANKIPPLIDVKYNVLFYDFNHYLENDYQGNHTILVSGFDSKKKVIEIREFIHVREAINSLIRGDIFCRLQLKEEYMIEILRNTNYFYYIEKEGKPRVNTYLDLVGDLLDNFSFENDNFTYLIKNIERYYELFTNHPNFLKIIFNGSLIMFFEALEKGLTILNNDESQKLRFELCKKDYMESRELLFSKLFATILHGHDLNMDFKEKLISEIINKNQILFSLIKELYKKTKTAEGKTNQRKNRLINYAQGAIVTADSEETPASNAINTSDNTLEWKSDENPSLIHWLCVDLGEKREVCKFIITHSRKKTLITKDFEIQGSNDGKSWDVLMKVTDNCDNQTEQIINPVSYRYFRLYITKPCEFRKHNKARIKNLQILG